MADADYFQKLGFQPDKKLLQQNIRIRKYLKNNKGKVSKKHKASLTKTMKSNTAKRNPTDPTTGLSVKSLDAPARAAANQKYGSTRTSYNQQIATVDTQLAKLDPYFKQYEDHLGSLATSAVQNAQAEQAQIMAQQQAANQQGQAGAQAIADKAGANPQAQAGLQAQDAAAQGRAALAQTSANAIAERGQIRGQQFQAQAANTGLQKNETRLKLGDNKKKVESARNELDQVIGEYFEAQKQGQIGTYLDNKLKEAALNLQNVKFKAGEADKAADNARADALAQNTIDDRAADNARADANVGSGGAAAGKKKPVYYSTPGGKSTAIKDFRKAYSGAKGTVVTKKATGGKYKGKGIKGLQVNTGTPEKPKYTFYALTPENERQIVSFADQKFGDPILAKAMAQQLIYGNVGPGTWEALRKKRGINPKSLGLVKRA